MPNGGSDKRVVTSAGGAAPAPSDSRRVRAPRRRDDSGSHGCRIGEDDGGFGAFDLVTAFWLGLAAALLIVGYVVRFAEVPEP